MNCYFQKQWMKDPKPERFRVSWEVDRTNNYRGTSNHYLNHDVYSKPLFVSIKQYIVVNENNSSI